MIRKLISGGQTGADIAGLIAAKKLGIETGGKIPKGWRTLDGPHPEYKQVYGLVEHPSWAYPPRTEANVRESDGTIRFATDWNSPGEKLTKKFIDKYDRPYFDVNPRKPPPIEDARLWLTVNKIQTLNVAGNSERTSRGIEKFVVEYLTKVLGETK